MTNTIVHNLVQHACCILVGVYHSISDRINQGLIQKFSQVDPPTLHKKYPYRVNGIHVVIKIMGYSYVCHVNDRGLTL